MMETDTPFTCHKCKYTKVVWEFESMAAMRDHRREFHPLDYADGLSFWMAEDVLGRVDYYWVARQIRDTRWLMSWG